VPRGKTAEAKLMWPFSTYVKEWTISAGASFPKYIVRVTCVCVCVREREREGERERESVCVCERARERVSESE